MYRNSLTLAVAATTLSLMIATALAQTKTPDESSWKDELMNQLMRTQQCQLDKITDLKTYERFKEQIAEGRAHCADNRAFDFDNKSNPEVFEFHACGPVLC